VPLLGAEADMNIYCDTNTLFSNIKEEPEESAALERLLADHCAKRIVMCRSRVNLREVMDTQCVIQLEGLIADYEGLQPIPNDEQTLGFNAQTDQLGGFVGYPLISDVQDEPICQELEQHGLQRRDAQHITQAVCNERDIFLTRDAKTIIRPHRDWLEGRFPNLKVRRPSELVADRSDGRRS
jgi:hypothetical protein